MYKCLECGFVFEEPLEWAGDNTLTEYGCPSCGFNDYEELVKCELCDNYHTEDEMVGEVCEDCVSSLAPSEMITISNHIKEEVELNLFLATVFSDEEIEEILTLVFNEMTADKQEKYKKLFVKDYPDEVSDCYLQAVEGGEI